MLLRMCLVALHDATLGTGHFIVANAIASVPRIVIVTVPIQVADARRGSTVAPRRSSVVVSQELGAILGKPNGLAAEAGSPSDARAAQPIADLPTVGRLQGHAFFPELGQLTKVRPELC